MVRNTEIIKEILQDISSNQENRRETHKGGDNGLPF